MAPRRRGSRVIVDVGIVVHGHVGRRGDIHHRAVRAVVCFKLHVVQGHVRTAQGVDPRADARPPADPQVLQGNRDPVPLMSNTLTTLQHALDAGFAGAGRGAGGVVAALDGVAIWGYPPFRSKPPPPRAGSRHPARR